MAPSRARLVGLALVLLAGRLAGGRPPSSPSPLSCDRPIPELVAALGAFRYGRLLPAAQQPTLRPYDCLKQKRRQGPGLAVRPAEAPGPTFFATPMTEQFGNPHYRPRLDGLSHPGCLFALNRTAVDWAHLTVLIVPTKQRAASPVSPASIWLVDMAGRPVLQKDTIFRGNLRSHRMINATALMAMVDCYLAEARPQPILLWVWDIQTNQEEVLRFEADLPPQHGAAHHDFTYNPTTHTVLVMYRFMNRDYDRRESPSLFMERLLEFSWAGRLLWHWDVHAHLPQRSLHAVDAAEGECQEHAAADCWDVFHGNTVFWDVREPGTGDGIVYYNSRHLDTFWKIDKRSGRVVWALGAYGNFTQYNITGHRRRSLVCHGHAVEPYRPGEFVFFDNNYATAEPSRHRGSRLITLQVDETRWEARETEAWGWARQSHQAGNALRLPNGHHIGMYTTQRMVVEADTSTGQLVWGYHLGLRHHTTLYRLERLSTVPTVRLLPSPPALGCPRRLTFEAFDVFRTRVVVRRTGRLTVFMGTSTIATTEFEFAPYWLPAAIPVDLPAGWCRPTPTAGGPPLWSVAVATQDGVGAQWPLEADSAGQWRLLSEPLPSYVRRHCRISDAAWATAEETAAASAPAPEYPAPPQWPPAFLGWLNRLMDQPTVV